MINLKDADTDTPAPDQAWRRLSDAARLTLATDALRAGPAPLRDAIVVVAAKQDGQIIVTLRETLPAGKRGTLLLDLEAHLNKAIGSGLVVWLEPLGDRNSLRNLRGIEVKS